MRVEVYAFEKEMETVDLSDPRGNVYKIREYGYQFADEEDLAALESATGKTAAALLAELNATITKDAYRTLAVDRNGRFLCSDVMMSGVTVTVFSYYGVIGNDGIVTLYKTAEGRDNADAGELVNDVAITVTAKGMEVATPISEGSESVRIERYVFDQVPDETVTQVLGNGYRHGEYRFLFDSAEALAAFEAEKGKTVAEILAELNEAASLADRRLTVKQDGRFDCFDIVTDGVFVSSFRVYGVIGKDGAVTLYKTAEGRDNAAESELVTDVAITVTAKGIEVATPVSEGSMSVLIATFVFDKSLALGTVDIQGNSYVLEGYGYYCNSMDSLNALEEAQGMTVEEILAQAKENMTEANKKWITITEPNLVTLIPIVEQQLDDSHASIDLVKFSDKGKIEKSVKYVDCQNADIPSRIDEDLFTVGLLTGQTAIIRADGEILHKLDHSYRIVDRYIVGTQAIYNFDLEKVYDIRGKMGTVIGIIENTVYINEDKGNGYDIVTFRDGETRTIFSYNMDNPSGNVFQLMEHAHCYMIYNAGSGEFSYYNSEDEHITNSSKMLTLRHASESHMAYLMWNDNLELTYGIFAVSAE